MFVEGLGNGETEQLGLIVYFSIRPAGKPGGPFELMPTTLRVIVLVIEKSGNSTDRFHGAQSPKSE